MSTVQESSLDSPTEPIRYSVLPRLSDDTTHNRSSSLPGDYIRDSQTLPAQPNTASGLNPQPAWTSRQAGSHPHTVPRGLGLSLPPSNLSERQSIRQGPSRAKPNLTIAIIKKDEERPPPPPPKSPRHSGASSSSRSPVSSIHDHSPLAANFATPGSIMRAALVTTQGSPVHTPPTLNAVQESYFPPSGDVQIRELDSAKTNNPQRKPVPLQAPNQIAERRMATKTSRPNIDKPMPRLPPPSSSFSVHIREVREAEKADREKTPTAILVVKSPPPAPADARSPSPAMSLDRPENKDGETSLQPPTTVRAMNRAPTPELGSRPPSPAVSLNGTSIDAKTLPILPADMPRSPKPEVRSFKPSVPQSATLDPLQTLQDLNKQCEALHARYSSLRSDRLRLSTGISVSLREQQPGPGYANTLLDQHLSLNAISSSMDICFAKLKSLDCRKEEAMATFLTQSRARSVAEARKSASLRPHLKAPSQESLRSMSEILMEPKSLTPEMANSAKLSSSPTITKTSPGSTTPKVGQEAKEEAKASPQLEQREHKDTNESTKRTTVIRASPEEERSPVSPILPDPPVSPASAISSLEEKPKRIRVKGIKAAKILGLVAQSVNGRPGSPGITLPDDTPTNGITKQVAVELQIQPTKSPDKWKTSYPPTPGLPPTPKRKPPPPPRQGTNDSVGSTSSSSRAESSPDLPEVKTPRASQDTPLGVKNAKPGILHSVQVFVDDDILDYYKGSGR